MKEEVYQQLLQNINAYYQTERVARDEAILNASLAAMQLMLAVKAKGLDSCPIGGFDRQAFMEKYQVDKRYVPLMLISIGKAAQPARPTSRISLEKVILPKGK
jgi:nitroreductase